MNQKEWRIWANVLRNRLDSHGLAWVIPLRIVALPHAELQQLCARPDAYGLISHLGHTPLFHITLKAIFRSCFSLPKDAACRARCRDLQQLLVQGLVNLPVQPHGLLRLLQLPEEQEDCQSIIYQKEKPWVEARGLQRVDAPCEKKLGREIIINRSRLEISETGVVFILFKKSDFLLEYENTLFLKNKIPATNASEYHITLGHIRSPQALRPLIQLLKPPLILSGLRLFVFPPCAVSYAHRSLGSLMRIYAAPARRPLYEQLKPKQY